MNRKITIYIVLFLPDPESDAVNAEGVCLLPRPLRDFFEEDIALRA